MTPTRGAIVVCSLITTIAFAGCFADEPSDDGPPVVQAPPPEDNITHNVTSYDGSFSQIQGPVGSPITQGAGTWPSPVLTTIDYTGLVVKLEWEASNEFTTTLKVTLRPDGDGEAIVTTGPSPILVPVDLTQASTRSWYVDVDTDNEANPVAVAQDQAFVLTIGQYADDNGTFDPTWDPVA